MPFAATCMDLEIIILSKSDRERQISYDIPHMWNLIKNDINKLIDKTEKDSQISKTNLWLPKGKHGEEGQIRNLGLTYTHYYI